MSIKFNKLMSGSADGANVEGIKKLTATTEEIVSTLLYGAIGIATVISLFALIYIVIRMKYASEEQDISKWKKKLLWWFIGLIILIVGAVTIFAVMGIFASTVSSLPGTSKTS